MKTFFLISFLVQFLFSYNIFSHSQDFRISSSSYTASIDNHKKVYNFFNPACNTDQMRNVYSILGSQFNGILENQQLYFSVNTELLERIYIGLLRTSIDDIYNTTSAWNDSNQNGNIDLNEIDYDMISTFTHSNIGLILSKPFYYKDFKFGINTKFDILSMLDEKSFSHSFDLGIIQKFKKLNIGIVFKDFLNQTYWTTGYKANVKSKLFFGINYDFKNITCLLEGTDSLSLNGTKNLVLNGSNADNYLVTVNHNDVTNIVVINKDTEGLSINNFKTVDDRRISQLNFENVSINTDQIVSTGDEAEQLLKDAINYGTLCVSAEAVGSMESCYLKTVEYTKSREQFGQPISNFQVLQHKIVDMFIETELCKSLLYKSMIDMHENNESKYRSVSALKSQVGISGKKVGEDAVQLHGGMGVSEEMSIGHYLKRFISIDSQFGNSHFHLKKFNNS